jgi:DNA-binding GntR family transcriptional regulator
MSTVLLTKMGGSVKLSPAGATLFYGKRGNMARAGESMGSKNANSRTSATERVEQYIRQSIYSGALKPRERLIEEDLAKQLACSRGPVREALLRLERDGLIVSLPRRGTFIRDISTESIEVTFAIRGKLEALCVRYLRQQLTRESEQILRKALKSMKSAAVQGDEEAFLQADLGLHRTIWKLANRDQLYLTLNTIMNPFIFMVARAFSTRTPLKERYQNHENYVETLLKSPIEEVEEFVESYFEKLYENLGIEIHPHLVLRSNATSTVKPFAMEA